MRRDAANLAAIIIVHTEQFGRTLPDQSQANDTIAINDNVVLPTLRARMKQRYELTVNVRGQIRPFVKTAPMARQTEIRFFVCAAMLPGDDVFNMERNKQQLALVASAAFTSVRGTLTNKTAKSGFDRHSVNSTFRRRSRHGL